VNDRFSTDDPTVPDRRWRLADFLPDGSAATSPAVTVTLGGTHLVVLRRAGTATVEAWQNGEILQLPADTEADPVLDPDRRDELLAAALHGLAGQRHHASEDAAGAQAERDRQRAEHHRVLREIRQYAIDKHRAQDICRDGLDTFLEHFGMDAYQPRLRVGFTIAGTLELDTDDGATAEHQVQQYLGLDTGDIDDAVEDSADIRVDVTSVDRLDT
jgi:hypothetical protein